MKRLGRTKQSVVREERLAVGERLGKRRSNDEEIIERNGKKQQEKMIDWRREKRLKIKTSSWHG